MIHRLRRLRDPRRRLRRTPALLFCSVVLIVLVIADQRGWLLVRAHDDFTAYHGMNAMVTRVIDGDTIEIAIPDALHGSAVTRVRLWGIDCPEAAAFDRPAEPFAQEATALAKAAVQGALIIIELEAHQTRDAFGRVLAHILLPDDDRLSELLLEAGLARAEERWAHSRLARHSQLETGARRRKVGIWSEPR